MKCSQTIKQNASCWSFIICAEDSAERKTPKISYRTNAIEIDDVVVLCTPSTEVRENLRSSRGNYEPSRPVLGIDNDTENDWVNNDKRQLAGENTIRRSATSHGNRTLFYIHYSVNDDWTRSLLLWHRNAELPLITRTMFARRPLRLHQSSETPLQTVSECAMQRLIRSC